MEYILKAAIKIEGNVFTGAHHGECLAKLKAASTQGFIVDDYNGTRFVDRKKALKIAIKFGQKITKYPPEDILLSEDLLEDDLFNKNEKDD